MCKRYITASDGKLFEIADALDINPSTLAEPDFDDPTSIMHVLFELEDIYGLHFEKVGENYQLAFSNGEYSSANWIIEGLAAWVKKEKNYNLISMTQIVPLQIRKMIISAGRQDIHIILPKRSPMYDKDMYEAEIEDTLRIFNVPIEEYV